MAQARYLHADLDAFYASVEILLNPELAGKPMFVGGGVVLAASYEARAFGIRAGMPSSQAKARCPQAIEVSGSFGNYLDYSDQVMAILGDATPTIEQISIDEAFLDVSGSIHLLGSEDEIATEIRRRVKEEVGLPISIGVASTKFLSKVASAEAKPDGLLSIEPGHELAFLHPLPVRALWGVGPVTQKSLTDLGITTVGEILTVPPDALRRRVGRAHAAHLRALAQNHDPRGVKVARRSKSIGAQSAIGRTFDPVTLHRHLTGLAERVGTRMRKKDRVGKTITVRVRRPGPRQISRSVTLPQPIQTTAGILTAARPLLDEAIDESDEPISLVGISISGIAEKGVVQPELPINDSTAAQAGSEASDAAEALDAKIDAIRARFGDDSVVRGTLFGHQEAIPDGFRHLAEKDDRDDPAEASDP